MTALRDHMMAVQLGRHWAQYTSVAGGLAFIAADDDTPGNLYAAPLPRLAHRLETAASITVVAAPAPDRQSPIENIALRVEAHAPTRADALDLVVDLRELLWPAGAQFVHLETLEDLTVVSGLIGRPEPELEPAEVWRIVTCEPLTTPVVVPGPAEGRSFEGQAVASIEVLLGVVRHTVPGFPTAWSAYRTGGAGEVSVLIDRLLLRSGINVTTYLFATYPTVGQLRAAVDAHANWITADHDPSFDARPSTDILPFPYTNAVPFENRVPIRLPAA